MSRCPTLELSPPPFQLVAADARPISGRRILIQGSVPRSSPAEAGAGKRRCDNPLDARVLFICDDDAVRDATLRLLRAFGYHAAAATSPEALARARDYTHLELIIADHCLDSTNGLDVIAALRSTCTTCRKALLLTYDPWLPPKLSAQAPDICIVERPLSGHGLLGLLHQLVGEPA